MKDLLNPKLRASLQKLKRWIKKPKSKLLLGAVIFAYIYLSGFLAQFPHNQAAWEVAGGMNSGAQIKFPSLNPFVCVWTVLSSPYRGFGMTLTFVLMLVFAVFYYLRYYEEDAEYDAERNFFYSKKGLYGTAGWMRPSDIPLVLDMTPEKDIAKVKGDILGIDDDGNILSVPLDSRMNRHMAVFGASGTMKSRAFSRVRIITSALRSNGKSMGESIIVTDPKGELFEDTSEYLRKKGYEIRVLNLVSPELSNGWNFMLEVERGGDMAAQTIADVIIQNTGGPKPDHFWDNAEMNLLKALMLYVAQNKSLETSMTRVYELLTKFETIEGLTALFNSSTVSPEALQPFNLFLKANENVRGNVMIGLGSRLQVFQNKAICRMTERDEFDLAAPAKRKCAYYCILSDQNSTLNFISSLFFSLLFIDLVKYVDTECKGPKKGTNIPVNFVLDEFPNIGLIPDFTKKISTIRSRNLNVSVIFQNLGQLENRYPYGQWEEILGNCDVQVCLGVTDLTSAEYISKRSGIVSVVVRTKMKELNEMNVMQYQPNFRNSSGLGKRFLLNPDEVLTMEIDKCLIMLRGQKILKACKFDFTRHPESKLFEPIEILKYNPVVQDHSDGRMNPPSAAAPQKKPAEKKAKANAPGIVPAPTPQVQPSGPPPADPQLPKSPAGQGQPVKRGGRPPKQKGANGPVRGSDGQMSFDELPELPPLPVKKPAKEPRGKTSKPNEESDKFII